MTCKCKWCRLRRSQFSFCDGLLLLFIGLKLTGHVDWSWFAVMSPIALEWLMYIANESVYTCGGDK